MGEKFLKQYEILLLKGEKDFSAAKYLFDGFNKHNVELNLEIVFFHLQQCAEKLIKAILDFNGIKFPHTHDLDELINLLNANKIRTVESIENLIPLTEFAVEGRYSIIHDELDGADKIIVILDELLAFASKTIRKE